MTQEEKEKKLLEDCIEFKIQLIKMFGPECGDYYHDCISCKINFHISNIMQILEDMRLDARPGGRK